MSTDPSKPQPRHADSLASDAPGAVGIPDLPDALVTRARLLDLLEEGVRGRLTLLSAPAGTGKTVLVSHWARTSPSDRVVIWLTTTGDDTAGQIWPRLLDALRRTGVHVPRLGRPSDTRSPSDAWLARLAAAAGAHDRPVVLVLDQAEQSHPALHRALARLMRSAGSSLHLVLLSRSDPVLPLNGYRLDNQLTEIRAAGLAFTEGEGAELFEAAGVSLSPTQVRTLVRRTSGWAVGLRLAAMGLQGTADQDAAVADFAGDQDNVATYLTTEVLRWQPPLLRDVLLRTSVVDALSPGLFEALTGLGSGHRAMAFLSRGNSFIETVPDSPGWYQYQSLVREFLRSQLEFERPKLAAELHHTAADWYARNGFLTKAVRHAAQVGAWDDAASYLIEDMGIGSLLAEISDPGRASTFADMPDEVSVTSASVVRAALDLGAADHAACARDLAMARASLAQDPVSSAACACSIALLDTLNAVCELDVESGLASAHAAEQQLQGNYPEAFHTQPELALLLALSRARLHLWQGDLDRAADDLEGLPADDTDPASGRLAVVVLGLRALVDAIRGRTAVALQHAEDAEYLARGAGVDVAAWSWKVPAARAWLLAEELDLPAAEEQLRLAEAAAASGSDMTGRLATGLLGLLRAHLRSAQGHPREAQEILSAVEPPVPARLVAEARPSRPPIPRPRVYAVSSVVSPAGSPDGHTASPGEELLVELTSRELEVLGLLAKLLTTTEIAATLFISVNTVRTHVRSILRKLAVVRRNDAVRRGWELGLIPHAEDRPAAAAR
jgi:LuxR family transcriptional regulator, maltose regulon positive regulatory protein